MTQDLQKHGCSTEHTVLSCPTDCLCLTHCLVCKKCTKSTSSMNQAQSGQRGSEVTPGRKLRTRPGCLQSQDSNLISLFPPISTPGKISGADSPPCPLSQRGSCPVHRVLCACVPLPDASSWGQELCLPALPPQAGTSQLPSGRALCLSLTSWDTSGEALLSEPQGHPHDPREGTL